MAQYDFGTIDPNTKSGTALASDLNSYRNAVNSMHSGSSAPSYITAGMMWVDTTSADYEVKLYDGAQSITVAIIDATNNVARVAVDPAETSYITSTTSAQIRHVIASTNIFTTRSTGIQFNLASPTITDNNSNEWLSFTTTASAVNHVDIANSATGGAVALSAAGTDTNISIALTPKGTGGVGIGTSSPSHKLDVRNGSIAAGNGTIFGGISYSSRVEIGAISNHNLGFIANNETKMLLDTSGQLMVGTTSASGLVTFEKTTSSSPVLVLKNPQFSLDCWTTNTTGDNVFARFFTETSATQRGSISYNRGGGLVAYNVTSDYRSKDVSGEILDASSTVLNLKPYMGTMKGATIERPMFIAHETQEIAPYAVTGEKDAVDNDGNPIYQQMDHSALVPLLTAALQEALNEIASTKSIITALETRLAALETSP